MKLNVYRLLRLRWYKLITQVRSGLEICQDDWVIDFEFMNKNY